MGGTATLIGDPPNIMIGSATGLSFMDFIVNIAPLILVQLVVFAGIFWLIFARKLHVTNENRARIMDFDEKRMIRNPKLLRRSMIVFGLVIVGFMLHAQLKLEAATIALAGAAALMIAGRINPEEVLAQVEWTTIFFFVGLFILVGGLVETGVINLVSERILLWTKGDISVAAQVIVWFSGIFSAIVDNIPFVATMIPLLKDMGDQLGQQTIMPLWWALSLGACLGGNGTLIGASANVVVAGFCQESRIPHLLRLVPQVRCSAHAALFVVILDLYHYTIPVNRRVADRSGFVFVIVLNGCMRPECTGRDTTLDRKSSHAEHEKNINVR